MGMIVNAHRFGGGAPVGPISFVGHGTYLQDGQGTPGTGPTFDMTTELLDTSGAAASIAANDFCIATWCTHNGVDLTIAAPTGFTKQCDLYVNDGQDTNFAVFTKVLTGSETSIVFAESGNGGNALSGNVLVLRGVDITNPLDVAIATATGIDTGQPDPPSITPVTAGSWIVVCGGAAIAATGVFTNPGDLSATTNHFRSVTSPDSNPSSSGIGLKTNWSSGAFDPAQWGGGGVLSFESWAAATLALRSA